MVGRVSRLASLGSLVTVALATVLAAGPAQAQLTVASTDGKTSFKLGGLAQIQAESLDNADGSSGENLFFRRLRILGLFKWGDKFSVFLETDSPNLGKANAAGAKDAGDVFIQDFAATYAFSKAFHVDAGMLLPALSYNHAQSAATLMPVDYGAFSFIESGPLQQRVGRDYGVQARGYVAGDKLEYRFGVFQGVRGPGATNSLRTAGRLMFYAIGPPQVGLFYRGTSLGKTRSLAFGVSADRQEDYDMVGGDVFFEQPFGEGNGVTAQLDWQSWDGDTFVAIPEQETVLAELGVYLAGPRLLPFVQYSAQDFDAVAGNDQEKLQVGVGYFMSGHNANLKLAFGRIEPDRGPELDQLVLQLQLFAF